MRAFFSSPSLLVGAAVFLSVTPLLGSVPRVLSYLVLIIWASRLRVAGSGLANAGSFFLVVLSMSFGAAMNLTSGLAGLRHAVFTDGHFLAGLAAGFVLASAIPSEDFVRSLGSWGLVFAGFSLVGVAIYTVFPAAVYGFPSYTFGTTHHTIGFANFLMQDGAVLQRNSGIASEPGKFQMILNLAAAAHLVRKPSWESGPKWYASMLLIAIALFTTRSTAGLVIFAILVTLAAVYSWRARLFAVGAWLLAGSSLAREFAYQAEYKLQGSSAFDSRLNPSLRVLSEVRQAPLGIGTATYNAKYEEMGWGSYDSYTQIFLRFGLPLLVLLTLLLVRNLRSLPLPTVVIALTFLSQPVWFVPLVSYFYFHRSSLQVARRSAGGLPQWKRLRLQNMGVRNQRAERAIGQ